MRRMQHSIHRRSFVLIAVMIIVGMGLLVATGLLFLMQADVAGAAGTADAAQSRVLAWSGVQAVMNRLDGQRDLILDGEQPTLESEYVIYETETRTGLVRLLPVTPAGDLVAFEAGKLDLNSVEADQLAATGLVEIDTARAIVRTRDQTLGRPFQSVAELLRVPGVTAELLYGPIEDLTVMDDALAQQGNLIERVEMLYEGSELRGLADVLTVYSFEPAIQRSGKLRINLNVPWSDELARRVDERFGEGASQVLKRLFDDGTRFENEAKIFQVLRAFNSEPENWPEIVDTVTTESGTYHFGRLDINSAPVEALRALPGLEAEQAAQIVEVRQDLAPEERSTIAWPAIEGIVEPEAYDDLAGHITTRCWTFRIRLAAGEVDAETPEAPLDHPVIFEAVIDLSALRPRVAYLREITLLQTTAMLASFVSLGDDERDAPTDGALAGLEDLGSPGDGAEARTEPAGFDGDSSGDGITRRPLPRPPPPRSARPAAAPAERREPAEAASGGEGSGRNRIGRWRRGG